MLHWHVIRITSKMVSTFWYAVFKIVYLPQLYSFNSATFPSPVSFPYVTVIMFDHNNTINRYFTYSRYFIIIMNFKLSINSIFLKRYLIIAKASKLFLFHSLKKQLKCFFSFCPAYRTKYILIIYSLENNILYRCILNTYTLIRNSPIVNTVSVYMRMYCIVLYCIYCTYFLAQ